MDSDGNEVDDIPVHHRKIPPEFILQNNDNGEGSNAALQIAIQNSMSIQNSLPSIRSSAQYREYEAKIASDVLITEGDQFQNRSAPRKRRHVDHYTKQSSHKVGDGTRNNTIINGNRVTSLNSQQSATDDICDGMKIRQSATNLFDTTSSSMLPIDVPNHDRTVFDKCKEYNIQYVDPNSQDRKKMLKEIVKVKKQRQRSQQPEEKRDKINKDRREKYSQKTPDEKNEMLENLRERRRRRKEKKEVAEYNAKSTSCSHKSTPTRPKLYPAMQQSLTQSCQDDDISVPSIPVASDDIVNRALEKITRTYRGNNIHKASVCVVCDRIIKGVETIHLLGKDRILLNKQRLSVKSNEEFYARPLNPILIEQYEIEDLKGILLSPRSHRVGDDFEACSHCFSSLKPSKAKKSKKPPKLAIANGFTIGHIPSSITTRDSDGNDIERSIKDGDINEMMCAAVSRQRPYGYIFAWSGGAHTSLMGNVSFFEMNQTHAGGVINYFRSRGANDHILCALCGRMTPKQKEIARNMSKLDTVLYLGLLNFFIRNSVAFADVTSPEDCPQPRVLEDPDSNNNTDDSINAAVEKRYEGCTYTFTSSQEPTESSGVYRSNADFTMAVLSREKPMLLVYGGKYVGSGTELKLEWVFPIQFPFGIGGPKMNRPTNISEKVCLQHYLQLSLPQFMRAGFIHVVNHLYGRLLSFQRAIVSCKSITRGGTSLAECISTLTESDISAAAKKKADNVPDTSNAALFLQKAETSCRAIAYSAAAAKYNRRLMYALCDRLGIPNVFFTCTPCDLCSWRVRLWTLAWARVCNAITD